MNYIETDALLNFLNDRDMVRVFLEWKHSLSHDGFVTTRVLASDNILKRCYHMVLLTIGDIVLGVRYKSHSLRSVINDIENARLSYIYGGKAHFFHFRRFSMIKNPAL